MKELLQELREFIETESVEETLDELEQAFGFSTPEKIIYVEILLEKIKELEEKYLTNKS